jgi:hypothetical protein
MEIAFDPERVSQICGYCSIGFVCYSKFVALQFYGICKLAIGNPYGVTTLWQSATFCQSYGITNLSPF